ncbi:hypothetical protein MCOR20_002090 [Pyricularia oryzae]|nr:hypothetical protein MCOR20_002090 [Pyricularia oryzae]
MAGDWGWEACFVLFHGRLVRMIMLCNRRGPTIDNVVTTYIECIWIICHGTVIIKSMTPEILSAFPTSLSDRDDSLCNIRIDTCSSNYAEHNYRKKDLGIVLQHVDECIFIVDGSTTRHLYNPQLVFSPYREAYEVKAEAVKNLEFWTRMIWDWRCRMTASPWLRMKTMTCSEIGIN